MDNMTWKCDICGEERPDNMIQVLSYPLIDMPGAERNLKFCHDRPECRAGAIEKSKTRRI